MKHKHVWVAVAESKEDTLHLGLHWKMTHDIYTRFECKCGKSAIKSRPAPEPNLRKQ